jgi:flagellar motility protein MotE (MotC chaperone)
MKELAAVYANKSSSELLSELGNDDKYSSMNLALIYRELSLKKAAEILLHVTDKEFVLGLYDSINLTEDLLEEDKNTAAELAAAVQVLQSYEANLNKLLPVYQKMPVEELAELVEQMLKSNQIYQRHTFSEEEIVFNQEQLVLDVLRRMAPARVAELLGQLSTARSAELSNKLMQN